MTIAVTVKSPEGIVLAADSVLTVVSGRDEKTGESRVLDLYRHSKKVHQIGEMPIGIITAGVASVGMRSLESYITELSNELANSKKGTRKIADVAKILFDRLSKEFRKEGVTEGTDIVCAGYSPGEGMPDVYAIGYTRPTT
jgi:20S proteasome alpha/beta subunit